MSLIRTLARSALARGRSRAAPRIPRVKSRTWTRPYPRRDVPATMWPVTSSAIAVTRRAPGRRTAKGASRVRRGASTRPWRAAAKTMQATTKAATTGSTAVNRGARWESRTSAVTAIPATVATATLDHIGWRMRAMPGGQITQPRVPSHAGCRGAWPRTASRRAVAAGGSRRPRASRCLISRTSEAWSRRSVPGFAAKVEGLPTASDRVTPVGAAAICASGKPRAVPTSCRSASTSLTGWPAATSAAPRRASSVLTSTSSLTRELLHLGWYQAAPCVPLQGISTIPVPPTLGVSP